MAWCDADAFAALAERGHTLLRQGEIEAARAGFAEALALYRGDYMDDCPFFGDSSYVEDRRVELRSQRIDTLLALGTVYERLGQTGGLLPPFVAGTMQADAMGRVLIEIWAEAARDGGLREQLRRCYTEELDRAMRADTSLSQVLRIGTLIQMLALAEPIAVEDAAVRLGISKAA